MVAVSNRAQAQTDGIIISEILANPSDESKGEFVELYNRGDTSVDLNGWRLMDRHDVNDVLSDFQGAHDRGLPGTVLKPGGYALVVDPDYDGIYDVSIGTNADTSRLIIITIIGDRTLGNGLGNGGDKVILDDNNGQIVEYTWSMSAGEDGRSWEKINSAAGDEPSNWSPAHSHIMSTPGSRNSVAPALFDAGIVPGSLFISPGTPVIGEMVTITFTVTNSGLNPLSDVAAVVFCDGNQNGIVDHDEFLNELSIKQLAPEGVRQVAFSLEINAYGPQYITIKLSHPDDRNSHNDLQSSTLLVAYSAGMMVINEIMFDPDDDQPEWIELLNRSPHEIDLTGWTIETADSTRRRALVTSAAYIKTGVHMIVTSDTTLFDDRYDLEDVYIFRPQGAWPVLLNNGTKISLRDHTGSIIDHLSYKGAWSISKGRSIERIHPDMPSSFEGTWGPSSSEQGATPGRRNTLFTDNIVNTLEVEIMPNPFSPDGDGHEDEVQFIFNLPSSRSVIRVSLFDIQGRKIRTIAAERQVGNRWKFVWDGRNDSGHVARIGPYILFIEYQDPANGLYRSRKEVVVLGDRL